MFQRKLAALQYPQGDRFDPNDEKSVRTLVVWLEEMKIRFYEQPRRAELRKIDAPDWENHFLQYLKDQECSRRYQTGVSRNPQLLAPVLDWLLSQAITAEYGDNKDKYNGVRVPRKKASSLIAPSSSKNLSGSLKHFLKPTLDCTGEEFETFVRDLVASIMTLPPSPTGEDPDVAVLLRIIRQRLLATRRRQQAKDEKSDTHEAMSELESYELGFTTGNAILDRTSVVLRLLYIQDLRDLQTLCNEVIASVQDVVAEPKTDARLGKVGR